LWDSRGNPGRRSHAERRDVRGLRLEANGKVKAEAEVEVKAQPDLSGHPQHSFFLNLNLNLSLPPWVNRSTA